MERLFLLIFCLLNFQIVFAQVENKKSNQTVDNYDFSVEINMNHYQWVNSCNYKYLINKGWDYDQKDSLIFFNDNFERLIKYKYVDAPQKGFDRHDRVPIDTIKFSLTNEQLDSIYLLTSKIFQTDSSIIIKNTSSNSGSYDGEYVTVSLRLLNYSTTMETMISFDEDKIFQKRFKELLKYIDRIDNAL